MRVSVPPCGVSRVVRISSILKTWVDDEGNDDETSVNRRFYYVKGYIERRLGLLILFWEEARAGCHVSLLNYLKGERC